jgi:hypothetical protein
MKGNLTLKEYILADSGEIVYATSLREAKEKLSRFHYTHAELQSVVAIEDYEGGKYVTPRT